MRYLKVHMDVILRGLDYEYYLAGPAYGAEYNHLYVIVLYHQHSTLWYYRPMGGGKNRFLS